MSGKKLPSIRINAMLNSIRTIMSIIFPMITYPYVTRILQADTLGKVNFSSSLIGYFSLVAVLGLTSYAAREGVQYRDDKRKLNNFCHELLTLNLCTTILAYIILVIVIKISPKLHEYIFLLIIYSATILFSTLGMEWLYTLHEDYVYITIRSLIIQMVSLILMFVFVKNKQDYYIYAAINVMASVGANIFNFFHARKYIKFKLIFNWKIFKHLKYSIVFFSSSIASSIYANIDVTMLGFACSDYNVGIYSAAVKIYTMIKSVLTSVTSVMMPRLTYYKSHNMNEEFNSLVSHLFKIMITFLLPVVVGLNMVAEEIIVVFCGVGFEEAKYALSILSFAIFFSMFATIVNGCILLPNKKEKKVLVTTITAAIVNFFSNLVAIPFLQQNGAAITTVLAEGVVLIVGWCYARKLVRLEKMHSILTSSIVGCVFMIILCAGINQWVSNAIISLVIKTVSCVLIYFVVCLISKNQIIVTYTKMVLNRIRHQK